MKLKKALSSLDSYFEKLKPTPPEPLPPAPQAAPASAAAAAPAETRGSSRGSEEAGAAGRRQGPGGGSGDDDAAPEGGGDVQLDLEQLVRQMLKEQGVKESDLIEFEEVGPPPTDFERARAAQEESTPARVFPLLLALNIAVFLFETASPEAVPGTITTSLPGLYGAKVNALILAGQWWRLITPMFLHAGPIHLLLGCSVLGRLGPAVELALGPQAFLAAYLVGGIFGDISSFAFTPEITIGGTGPLYGLLGAWVAYLLKNRDAVGAEFSDRVTRTWLLLGGLNIVFGNPLPIDDMNHYGGLIGGLLFGALVAPTIEIKKGAAGPAPPPQAVAPGGGGGDELTLVSKFPGPGRLALAALLLTGVAVGLYELAALNLIEGLVPQADLFT